ncbi:hypothetical protein [Campylobacter sputorum]|uniref:hypothetical protein n=1 Tax=Campylobacter sputorum TaxID=206 RepID=UPI001D0D4852|nr:MULTISPECIES: hypothetical protein [Campylobacter]ASM40789.1 hypothetical protein CSPB_1624 [Campylobacter sputorum]
MKQVQTQSKNLPKKEKIAKKSLSLTTKKEIAKLGMAISMGLVVLSAFNTRSKFGKNLHIVSGAALVGFSYYHTKLYNQN